MSNSKQYKDFIKRLRILIKNRLKIKEDIVCLKQESGVMSKTKKKSTNLLELPHSKACEFFMENESYCNFELPPYIVFKPILKEIDSVLKNKKLSDFCESKSKEKDKIGHTLLHIHNKDGKYAWRPIQLIHPALYMSLVHNITKEEHWSDICKRFKKFKDNSPRIQCMSLPLIPDKKKETKPEQILSWWKGVQQSIKMSLDYEYLTHIDISNCYGSIKMSLDYEYLTHIDISNCYGSIYTHSVSWAIHGKEDVKKDRTNKELIGNIIDEQLRDMSYGQTNGIPQGSVLMDFIAEMVLGYIDCELTEKIKQDTSIKDKDYYIIRYRDDYRIFTNSLRDGEKIVRLISEILVDFGMSLNPNKTKPTDQLREESFKSYKLDRIQQKLYWIQQKQSMGSVNKHLTLIHLLSKTLPNSGSLKTALGKFYDRIKEIKKIEDVYHLISIILDITYHNPGSCHISTPIISQLMKHIDKKGQKTIIEKIRENFREIPNTGHLDIWLQRVVIGFDESISFDEPICKIVAKQKISIWDSSWLKEGALKNKIKDETIVDRVKLKELKGKPIKREEFAIFPKGYY